MRAVIFDLDGVIVSTDNLHYQAWKKMADKEQIYFDEVINNRLRGVSRMASLEMILERATKKYTNEEKIALTEFKNEIYKKLLMTLSEKDILPGVMDILEELKARGIKVGIGSSSRNAKTILKRVGLLHYFDCISDGNNITKSKPDPEVFEKAAEMLGLPNEECAVVEDAHAGIIAAKSAGMIAFAVGDALESTEKDYDFTQILEIIKQ